jgi:Leucine-rich repeat (LRR) protein
LSKLKNLRFLALDDTKITNAGLNELAGLKSLRSLSLTGTRVTAGGIAELQKLLPNTKIVRYED